MKRSNKSKKIKKRNYSKLITRLILILIIVYVIFTFYDQHGEMKYLKSRKEDLLKNISIIEKEIKSLKDQIKNSDTDEYIEKIAREHLKMVKDDELIFIDMGKKP